MCVFSAAIYIHLYLIRLLRFSGLLFLFINSNSSSQMYTFTEGGICDRERYCTKANEKKQNEKNTIEASAFALFYTCAAAYFIAGIFPLFI